MSQPLLTVLRLRVLQRGNAVYDEQFHFGVNIIRGTNGSGKSTIADFIFFALGGEFDDWKVAAKRCDEVQAEVLTRDGTLTVRRTLGSPVSPAFVFFGTMEQANEHALDGWQRCPIHRQPNSESFSQILFRSMGIPEAQSEGSSNITMHQILRLMYSDQRTPAPRLFRFEPFDSHTIREAVGQLLCGQNVYEGYELQMEARQLERDLSEARADLDALLKMVPTERGVLSMSSIQTEITTLEKTAADTKEEIESVDSVIKGDATAEFLAERKKLYERIDASKKAIHLAEKGITRSNLDIEELGNFIEYLEENLEKLKFAEQSASIVGGIDFTHCPSCLAKLDEKANADACLVCGKEIDSESQQSKYLQIRLDFQTQLRESRQLLEAKEMEREKLRADARRVRSKLKELIGEFSSRYDTSNSPRESYLAERHRRLGRIGSNVEYLEELRELAGKIDWLTERRESIAKRLAAVKERLSVVEKSGRARMQMARGQISEIAVGLLHSDLPRQEEFISSRSVEVNFYDDAVLVDGAMNFAESSNVILKNTAILSLLAAACNDSGFHHPRFSLFDNIEDKGMEDIRSHNFQQLIVDLSNAMPVNHQIILTTSTINPELDSAELCIGPKYDRQNRTLQLDDPGASE